MNLDEGQERPRLELFQPVSTERQDNVRAIPLSASPAQLGEDSSHELLASEIYSPNTVQSHLPQGVKRSIRSNSRGMRNINILAREGQRAFERCQACLGSSRGAYQWHVGKWLSCGICEFYTAIADLLIFDIARQTCRQLCMNPFGNKVPCSPRPCGPRCLRLTDSRIYRAEVETWPVELSKVQYWSKLQACFIRSD